MKKRTFIRKKGTSILELIMVMFLFGIILSTVYSLFIPCIRIFKQGQSSIVAQHTSLRIMNTMGKELKESNYRSFVFRNMDGNDVLTTSFDDNVPEDIQAVAFVSPYDINNKYIYNQYSGMPEWQKFVIYYLVFQDTFNGAPRYALYRKTFTSSDYHFPSLAPFRIGSGDLTNITSDIDGARRIASNINKIEFKNPSNNSIGIRIYSNIDYSLEKGQDISELDTVVYLRN